ncbi:MAG TPA: GNAT family N-acetyltransferase [Gaiellaceae bacterium]
MIETERLLLRLPEPSDADGFAEALGDPEVVRYLSGVARTREGTLDVIERMRGHWDRYGSGLFTIERREDGAVLGRAGFLVWDPRTWVHGLEHALDGPLETEIGWTLARRHWGHGYATEAALAARDWAFQELRLPRLISLIHPDNVRSQRVSEKLGQRYERDVVTRGRPAQLWST